MFVISISAGLLALVLAYVVWRQQREIAALQKTEAAAKHPRSLVSLEDKTLHFEQQSPSNSISSNSRESTLNPGTMAKLFSGGLKSYRELKSAEAVYGWFVDGLNLPKDESQRLKYLLVQRIEARADAHDLAAQSGMDSKSMFAAEATAEAQLDEDIKATVGDGLFPLVKDLFAAEEGNERAYQVSKQLNPDYAFAGVPLSVQQSVGLAKILTEVYDSDPANADEQRASTMDPITGLSTLDQQVLAEAKQQLSPDQLQILAAELAYETRSKANYIKKTQSLHSSK